MAVDMFLKIDGIDGEAMDPGHENEIQVESFSFGESQFGTVRGASGGGGGAGKVQVQDIHFVTKLDKSTPILMLACATGEHIKEAVLTCRKAGDATGGARFEYLKVCFVDILVSSYQTGGSAGDVVPTDQISLNFAKIEMTYTYQDQTGKPGTVRGAWDVKGAQEF